jgi:hypothetical protein
MRPRSLPPQRRMRKDWAVARRNQKRAGSPEEHREGVSENGNKPRGPEESSATTAGG